MKNYINRLRLRFTFIKPGNVGHTRLQLLHAAFLAMLLHLVSPSPLYPSDINNEYLSDKSPNLLVKPFMGLNVMEFSFEKKGINNKDITYVSRPQMVTGLSLSWEFLGISAGYRIPVKGDEYQSAGKERSFDMRINYYGRRFGCDLYAQRQKGFFIDVSASDNNALPYHSQVYLNNASINLYYIFSWKTFSMRAAFDGTDIQKKSASSFMLRAGSGMLEIKSNSSLLLDENETATDRMHGLDYCYQKYISLSPGYGWTFVFYDGYYFNFTLFMGMGVQKSSYRTDFGESRQWGCFPDPDTRFSIGYSSDRLLYGLTVVTSLHIISPENDLTASYNLFNIAFHAGYRFF